MSIAIGEYFFLIAFILAHLEIQIEGPHGWRKRSPPGAGTAAASGAGSGSP
jgi:hypothetical protein